MDMRSPPLLDTDNTVPNDIGLTNIITINSLFPIFILIFYSRIYLLHLWFLQESGLLHICSHGGQFPSQHFDFRIIFLFFKFYLIYQLIKITFLLHLCFPQLRILLHFCSHKNSVEQGKSFSFCRQRHFFITN